MSFFSSERCSDIDQAIIYSPCILDVSTSLNEAVQLMSKSQEIYSELTCKTYNYYSHLFSNRKQVNSCILVTKNDSLVGIVTQGDLIELIYSQANFQATTIGEVMTTSLITLPYGEFTDLFIAYNLMRTHSIRHLPILDSKNNILGVVSLSSLRQALHLGHFLRLRQVKEIMSHDVVWATPDTPLIELAQIMSANAVSYVVLAEFQEQRLTPVGIITERDLVKFQAIELNLATIPASKLMSRPLFCLTAEDTLAMAHQKMQELKIGHIVIIGEKRELTGIVTEANLSQVLDHTEIYGVLEILQHRVSQLEQEKAELLRKQGLKLHQAIEKNQFELYYQPQFNLKTKRIIGAEALIRWHCPERGLILPAEFIPLAENTSLIFALGNWLLNDVCRQIIYWQEHNFPVIPISINLSSKQFSHPDLAKDILSSLSHYNIQPNLLKLELTESLLVQNIEITIEQFKALKSVGIGIAIDDFGTGYASLGYLQRFPFDTLKIDRCFIENIHHNAKNAAITNAIINMAKQLHFEVVAEGVETLAERDFLLANGCELIQGYLISKPLPSKQFRKFFTIN